MEKVKNRLGQPPPGPSLSLPPTHLPPLFLPCAEHIHGAMAGDDHHLPPLSAYKRTTSTPPSPTLKPSPSHPPSRRHLLFPLSFLPPWQEVHGSILAAPSRPAPPQGRRHPPSRRPRPLHRVSE